MKTQLTHEICTLMQSHLSEEQNQILEKTLLQVFSEFSLPAEKEEISAEDYEENTRLINLFIAAKATKSGRFTLTLKQRFTCSDI